MLTVAIVASRATRHASGNHDKRRTVILPSTMVMLEDLPMPLVERGWGILS